MIFSMTSDKIVIAYAKDVKFVKVSKNGKEKMGVESERLSFRGPGNIELLAPRLGQLDYSYYLKSLVRVSPNIPIIIEHLTEDDIPRAKSLSMKN